jgi:lipopolysaccharide/colanic/teichoic acid biosynthesis glycosyltransferase
VTGLMETRTVAVPGLWQDAAKRATDLAVSSLLLVILAPFLLLLCLLVWTTSAGPAVFRQERVGRDGQTFSVLKLRTMYTGNDDRIHREYVTNMLAGEPDAQQDATGLFKLKADPRVTRPGVWLRRTSLDELPQLINVLRGEMSLVGPRPVLPWEAQQFGETFQQRFAVKPGITGLWQVSGRSKLSMRRALELDVEYVLRRSFALDLAIMLRTVPALFQGGAR